MWQEKCGRNLRVMCAFRGAVGASYVVWAARSAVGDGDSGTIAPSAAVAGILGTRHVAQALLTVDQPTSAVLVLGAEADAAHAATMAVVAAASGRWRWHALADTVIAASLAAASLACAADAPASDPRAGRLLALRDRWARWLAQRLVPGARPARGQGRGQRRGHGPGQGPGQGRSQV
jgi:hypothetical protein